MELYLVDYHLVDHHLVDRHLVEPHLVKPHLVYIAEESESELHPADSESSTPVILL